MYFAKDRKPGDSRSESKHQQAQRKNGLLKTSFTNESNLGPKKFWPISIVKCDVAFLTHIAHYKTMKTTASEYFSDFRTFADNYGLGLRVDMTRERLLDCDIITYSFVFAN